MLPPALKVAKLGLKAICLLGGRGVGNDARRHQNWGAQSLFRSVITNRTYELLAATLPFRSSLDGAGGTNEVRRRLASLPED